MKASYPPVHRTNRPDPDILGFMESSLSSMSGDSKAAIFVFREKQK